MITIKNYFPTRILLDDEDTGEPQLVTIHVKRLTVDEYGKFKADFNQCADPPSNRLVARKPDGDEQERHGEGLFRVSDTQVIERRLFEMDPAARARFDEMLAAEELLADQFIKGSVRQYVTVPDGEIHWDGRPITTGEGLLDVYCSRIDVLRLLVRSVLQENTLSAAQKKILKSLSASMPSSSTSPQAPVGPRPEGTAAPASAMATVSVGDVTASIEDRSGSAAV